MLNKVNMPTISSLTGHDIAKSWPCRKILNVVQTRRLAWLYSNITNFSHYKCYMVWPLCDLPIIFSSEIPIFLCFVKCLRFASAIQTLRLHLGICVFRMRHTDSDWTWFMPHNTLFRDWIIDAHKLFIINSI